MGEQVLVILDPDFVFLRAITQAPLPTNEMLGPGKGTVGANVVSKGKPVAQRYGLGGSWVTRFNVKKIAGEGSPALSYTENMAARYFAVGPPLMLHVDDLTELAPLWSKNMKEVFPISHDILSDMWAYCIAAAHLRLEHTILDQYMISTWSQGRDGQAFGWVDDWPGDKMNCSDPERLPPGVTAMKPNFVHMASNFKAPGNEQWMFHKGHVPGKILDCDQPYIIEAPHDLWQQSKPDKMKKQCAWVLCNIVYNLNRVLKDTKEKFCQPEQTETRHLVKLIQTKTTDAGCSQHKDKWCYPLAQIEGLEPNWRLKLKS